MSNPLKPRLYPEFLQYRSWKTEKVGEFVWSGKGQGANIIFDRSGHDLGSYRLQIYCNFFVSPNIKKQANLWLPLNVLKLAVFQLQRGFCPSDPRLGLLSFCTLLH